MADHLVRIEQLAHDIGIAERPLTKSEIAVAMLQSMPLDYTVMVQVIQGADKGTDPVYVYNKLVDEEQRRSSEKPQGGSNDKSDKALNASHRINKSGETRKCFKCNRTGHIAKNCRSKGKNSKNDSNSGSNNGNSGNNNKKAENEKFLPCPTCKKMNHPEDHCFYKKIYEQAKAALAAEAKLSKTQTWGTSPDLSS